MGQGTYGEKDCENDGDDFSTSYDNSQRLALIADPTETSFSAAFDCYLAATY